MVELGKTLMLVGGVILCIGVLLTLGGNLSWLRWIGRLPGDIVVQRDHFWTPNMSGVTKLVPA